MRDNSFNHSTPDQARAYLERIRANSCYSTLRSFINIATGLCLVLLVFYAVFLFIMASGAPLDGGAAALLIGYAIGALLLGGVFILAARQAALLFVDLVDTQIEKNARN